MVVRNFISDSGRPILNFSYLDRQSSLRGLWLSVDLQGNVRRAFQSRALESTLKTFPDHLTKI